MVLFMKWPWERDLRYVNFKGWESTLQGNVMGTALLGLLLLPKLKASRSSAEDIGHLVIVTSEAHRWLEASDFPDPAPYGGSLLKVVNAEPAKDQKFNGLLQNARSKLFAMYVSNGLAELATRPDGEVQAIVTATCPGACKSDLMWDFEGSGLSTTLPLKIFDLLFNKTTEGGGRVCVHAASLGSEAHGGWYKTSALTT